MDAVASGVGYRDAIAEIDTRVVEGSLGADFNSRGVEIGASVRNRVPVGRAYCDLVLDGARPPRVR
jgi:hypothetical protein